MLKVLGFLLGGFLAVLLIGFIVYYTVKRKLKRTIRTKLHSIGVTDAMAREVVDAIKQGEVTENTTPCSLSGMDSILIPKIKNDFPDFNVDSAKQYAREYIESVVENKNDFKIHNIVFHSYNRYKNEKVIVMQAAFQHRINNELRQKRMTLKYSYLLTGGENDTKHDAANCPNCGAAFSSSGSQVCEYCGSYVAQILKTTWEFTEYKID